MNCEPDSIIRFSSADPIFVALINALLASQIGWYSFPVGGRMFRWYFKPMGANGFDGVVNSEARAEVPVARKTMGKSQKPILNWLSRPN